MNTIRVNFVGNYGNNLIQLMVAESIRLRTTKDLEIVINWRLPGLSEKYPVKNIEAQKFSKIINVKDTHVFEFESIIELLSTEDSVLIELGAYCQRTEYFSYNQKFFQENLLVAGRSFECFDNNLLINIRGKEIFSGGGGNQYFPLPISYYQNIVDSSGLEPVFFGQLDSFYGELLRRNFKSSMFIECDDLMTSFQIISSAKFLSIPISTFSWCAAFLSKRLDTLYFPVAGLFNYYEGRYNKKMQANFLLKNKNIKYYCFDDYFLDVSKPNDLTRLLISGQETFYPMSDEDFDICYSKIYAAGKEN